MIRALVEDAAVRARLEDADTTQRGAQGRRSSRERRPGAVHAATRIR